MDKPTATTGYPNGDDAVASTLQRGVDSAGAALHRTIDKVAEPARSTVDRLSTAAHHTVDTLATNATGIADRVSDQTRRVTDAPARAIACSRSWIQGNPLEAVGIALALGLIAGRLSAR